MNAPEASTVASGHIEVEPLDSISTAKFAEFLVHVVRSRARIITNPDTEDLDLQGLAFMNLVP